MNRRVPLAVSLLAMAGCGRAPSTPSALGDPPIARMAKGSKDRAKVLGSSQDTFGSVRETLGDLAGKGVVFLELHDVTRSAVVELPASPALDDPPSVVVVRIDATGRYGTAKVSSTAALEDAARRDRGGARVALLRVADDVTIEQLMLSTDALKRAGMEHVVLGLAPAGIAPPSDGWLSCPYPPSREGETATVVLLLGDASVHAEAQSAIWALMGGR